ncbi:MAG: PilZ domain-containing protein [Defluviitaleaceae bacterium]|nr:PilZ domain-containing protein [Defluviitaleaceae bacterium]
MSLKFVKQGTKVDIRSHYGDDSPYITSVDTVMENGRVLVDIMRLGGDETRLSENKSYTLRFFSERGLFRYEATLRGYMKKGKYDYMLFQTEDDGKRIQRRQAFRLSCGLDVEFDILGDEIVTQKGFVRDISSGGVRLLTKEELNPSHLIQLKLPMVAPDFWVYCAILAKNAIVEARYKWQYGIEFIGATDADTEKLTSYVYAEQQKARARD